MAFAELTSIRGSLDGAKSTPEGVQKVVRDLGYSLLPERQQLLDIDTLLQQRELREKVSRVTRLFSEKGKWKHPSGSEFDRDAVILLFELTSDDTFRSRSIFEITRYVIKFHLQTSQALLFFIGPLTRTFVVTAYTAQVESRDRVEVRRLVVELDNITRTDVEALSALTYSRMKPTTIIGEFEQALPYFKVGKDFFEEYHQHFQILSKKLKGVFDSPSEAYGYLQRLLGRITFLHFLQRKGWLDGDRAYLKRRLAPLSGEAAFDFLYALFDALNTEGQNKGASLGNIPFLNGSLFEKESHSQILTKKIRSACGPLLPDILKSFARYNFTISESTPLDKEVAVDPELLGSIFESMLPETERGDKGTFYTHQDDMYFMAREGLRCYLSRFPELLNPEQIYNLVYGIGYASADQNLEPRLAREVKETLRQIKILDPAVGSGGFLLAALQAILEVRERLDKTIGSVELAYDVKQDVIEFNLFGVDLESEAIELARLRLWLSLVVDESIENVRPLPNLDDNLHEGDSLAVPQQRQVSLTIDYSIRNALNNQIATSREKYIHSHGVKKIQAKQELDEARKKLYELETGKSPKRILFSYQYLFSDILANGGFDLILMNPPYIQQEDIGKLAGQNFETYKTEIANGMRELTLGEFTANKQSDISVYFHIRALSLLKDEGAAVVIATNKWLDVRYGIRLQDYLLRNSRIDCIFDSSKRSFAADVNTIVSIIRKARKRSNAMENLVRFVNFKTPFGQIDADTIREIIEIKESGIVFKEKYRITIRSQEQLYNDGLGEPEEVETEETSAEDLAENGELGAGAGGTYLGTKWGNLHLRAPTVYYEILTQTKQNFKPFRDLHRTRRGLTSGDIDYFILQRKGEEEDKSTTIMCSNGLGHTFKLERRYAPAVLRNPDEVVNYSLSDRILPLRIFMCREDRKNLKRTKALEYIEWGETSPDAKVKVIRGRKKGQRVQVSKKSTVVSRGEDWYQLPDIEPARVFLPKFAKNRHLIPRSTNRIFSTDNFYPVYSKQEEDLWLYMNSSVFRLFMELNGRSEGAGALQLMVYEYKQITIPAPIPPLSKKFKLMSQFAKSPAFRFVNIAEDAPLEFEQEDRKQLDELVLEELGFSDSAQRSRVMSQIYEWLKARVYDRLTKPKTAPDGVINSSKRKIQHRDLREFY